MRTTEAVKGQWEVVFKHYGLPPITGNRHYKGECPICQAKDRFRIDDIKGTGSYICTCSSGDGWTLLQKVTGKKFQELTNEVDAIIGNRFDKGSYMKPEKTEAEIYADKVLEAYPSFTPLTTNDNGAVQYLINRGITTMPQNSVRFRANPNGLDAMVAIVTDENMKPCYTHTTYIKGGKKAGIDTPKVLKSMQTDGYLSGVKSPAIRMSKADDVLGIAEGIETALSAQQLFGVPTWSVCNANMMARFKAPAKVKHLFIFADCDEINGVGLAAAFNCASKNMLQVKTIERVTVIWREKGGDMNDQLHDKQEYKSQEFRR